MCWFGNVVVITGHIDPTHNRLDFGVGEMSEFKQLLSSDDYFELYEKYDGNASDIIYGVERATLAKLAEQEPVAWKRGKAIFENKAVAERAHLSPELRLEPLYAHPMPETKEHHRTTKNPKKSIEQHRAEFEKWTRSHYFLCELTLHRDGEDYSDLDIGLAWESWNAAKGIEE